MTEKEASDAASPKGTYEEVALPVTIVFFCASQWDSAEIPAPETTTESSAEADIS